MEKEIKSSQEYREYADQHLKAVKSSLCTFFGVGVFFLAGIVIWAALSAYGWFVNNKKVSGEGMLMNATENAIELRSYGGNGVHDDVLKNILGVNGEKNFWYSQIKNGKLDTSQANPAVNWLLSDESNIGNYKEGSEVDWSDPENVRTDYAIEPGANGNIQFYVVPKISGDINVRCHLTMFPYTVSEQQYEEIPYDEFVVEQLHGHILFFLQNNNQLQWIKDKEFTIMIPDAEAGKEYLYTIHWSWAQTFGEILLTAGDSYLNGRELTFNDYDNGADIRTAIVDDMVKRPERFFYSSLTRQPLNKEYGELAHLNELHQKSTGELMIEGNTEALQAFVDLNSYYNQTDQYIGKNISCVRVALNAELYNTEN